MRHLKRRTILKSAVAAALAGSFGGAGFVSEALAAANPRGSAASVPPVAFRPRIRWWWPGGAVDPVEIRREVDSLADAGFGGFEIADVRDGQTVATNPATQGWASPAWVAGVEAALDAAARRGMTVDLTLGPHWPTGIPGVMPDDDAASKELVHGAAVVPAGAVFRGPVPPPLLVKPSGEMPVTNENPPVTPRLIALQAMRVVSADGKAVVLDPGSLVELTAHVVDGKLEWQAPAGGEWRLLAFWMRGTAQIQNMFAMNRKASMLADPKPYVIDIYGKAAAKALTEYWERHLLPPRTRELLRQAGGAFFEDSLEMSAACNWTPDLLAEFAARRGYRLEPYLALLPSTRMTLNEAISGRHAPALYLLQGVDRERVRHDFDRTLAEMYDDYRVRAVGEWAHSLGMKFRVQVVGSNVNSGVSATLADIPEGDNGNDLHGWRHFAAGRDIGGKRVLSDEAGTFVGGSANVANWRDLLYMLQRDYSAGVNQAVIHGMSYADGPGAAWPGFSAFGHAIGNDWGLRDPTWTVAEDIAAYIARLQWVLQQGVARTDVAVVRQPLRSLKLLRAGYTWQYPAMELFERPDMVARDGVLLPEGPAYRALVLNRVEATDAAVAKRWLALAEAGLPVVVVGEAPARARGWKDAAHADTAVRESMAALLRHPRVRQVSTGREVSAALAALGVAPSLGFADRGIVWGVRRQAAAANWYFLLNGDEQATQQEVRLTGKGTPYAFDPWSGTYSVAPGWRRDGAQVVVPLDLARDEVAIYLVTESPPVCMAAVPPALSGALPAPRELTQWSLEVEDWQKGATASTTNRVRFAVPLDALKPWSAIDGLRPVSGVGRYRSVLKLPQWNSHLGAWLELGNVGGTARVTVNGTRLPPVSVFRQRVEVGALLRAGTNLIEVMVATNLNNRLKAEGVESHFGGPPGGGEGGGPPPESGGAPPGGPGGGPPGGNAAAAVPADERDGPSAGMGMQPGAAPPGLPRQVQDYGLLGPVRLVPFTQR